MRTDIFLDGDSLPRMWSGLKPAVATVASFISSSPSVFFHAKGNKYDNPS